MTRQFIDSVSAKGDWSVSFRVGGDFSNLFGPAALTG